MPFNQEIVQEGLDGDPAVNLPSYLTAAPIRAALSPSDFEPPKKEPGWAGLFKTVFYGSVIYLLYTGFFKKSSKRRK